VSFDLPTPERALAIAAHPDDVEFQCGATLAKWAAAGCVINHLICTDGSKGTWDVDADLAALVVTRQAEQRIAAARLGATGEVVFLGWSDGELDTGLRQRWEIAYWIRAFRPDVVLGHDPWKRYRLHPDHRAAGLLACDGVVAARDPHFFPEQAIPHHRPSALLLFEADEADHTEVVTAAHAEAKIAALLAHESQFETTMEIDLAGAGRDAEQAAFRDRIIGELAEAGAAAGGDVDLAERFKLIDDL
jgi:LmbE family N-acetylglucosaminyl deacetylase